MDISTPKGQTTLEQEGEAIDIFCRSFPDFRFIETPKDRPGTIDGFIVQKENDVMVSGVEVKCRTMSRVDLKHNFGDRWLVTHDKIERGVSVCEKLCVDFRGFLFLVPDRLLLIVPIWIYGKGFVCDMELENSKTQQTVNGGSIFRLNAYIDVSKAREVR